MKKEEIFKQISEFIENLTMSENEITNETKFSNDLGFDSLDNVELLIRVEDVFCISITDEQAEKVETVGQAVDLIQSLVKELV